jgi:hypothetical protein
MVSSKVKNQILRTVYDGFLMNLSSFPRRFQIFKIVTKKLAHETDP